MIRFAKRIIRKLWRLTPRDLVPRAPRLWSTHYRSYDDDHGRVMARLGIRTPDQLDAVMRRRGAESVDELVAMLDHHRARRNLARRLRWLIVRGTGGAVGHPHRRAISSITPTREHKLIDQRVRHVKTLTQGIEPR